MARPAPKGNFGQLYAAKAKLGNVGDPHHSLAPNDTPALVQKREDLQEQLRAVQGTSSRLDKLKVYLDHANAAEQEQVSGFLEGMSSLPDELTRRLHRQVREQSQRIADLESALEEARLEVGQVEEARGTLLEQLAEANSRNSQLRQQLENETGALSEDWISTEQARSATERQRILESEWRISTTKHVQELVTQLDDSRQNYAKNLSDKQAYFENQLRIANDNARTALADKDSEANAAAKDLKDQHTAALAAKQQQCDEYEQEIEGVTADCEEAQDSLDQAVRDLDKAARDHDEVASELAEARRDISLWRKAWVATKTILGQRLAAAKHRVADAYKVRAVLTLAFNLDLLRATVAEATLYAQLFSAKRQIRYLTVAMLRQHIRQRLLSRENERLEGINTSLRTRLAAAMVEKVFLRQRLYRLVRFLVGLVLCCELRKGHIKMRSKVLVERFKAIAQDAQGRGRR